MVGGAARRGVRHSWGAGVEQERDQEGVEGLKSSEATPPAAPSDASRSSCVRHARCSSRKDQIVSFCIGWIGLVGLFWCRVGRRRRRRRRSDRPKTIGVAVNGRRELVAQSIQGGPRSGRARASAGERGDEELRGDRC